MIATCPFCSPSPSLFFVFLKEQTINMKWIVGTLVTLFFVSLSLGDAVRLTDDNVDDYLTTGDWLLLMYVLLLLFKS